MSAFSNLVLAVQHTLELIQGNSPWQLLRLSLSSALTVPMFFSDHPQVRFVALLLSSIVLSAFAFGYSSSCQEAYEGPPVLSSTPAIRVLSKFLIPTTSIWPKTYLDITRAAEQSSTRKCLRLRLETIFRDFRRGMIEVQEPSSDLPRLIKGQLKLDDWIFKLDLSLKNKAQIWTWVMSEELSLLPDEGLPKPCYFTDEDNLSAAERTVLKHYCSLFFETIDDIIIWPSLDAVPRAFVQQFIRSTQESLKAKHTAKKTSVFSFTTNEAGLSVFDDEFVYAALPFSRIFSKGTKDACKKASLCQRSSTPLFTRLPEILALLSSSQNALHVLNLSNASGSYANALDAHATALEYDRDVRRECIKAVGVQGWREERMYARWEAALLRAGLLTRWVILLEVKE